MKTTLSPTLKLLCIAASFIISGCQKNLSDKVASSANEKESVSERIAAVSFPVLTCRIERIRYSNDMGNSFDTVDFSYNAYNNPTKMIYRNNMPYMYPHYYFKYDGQQRLVGVRSLSDTTSYDSGVGAWEKITYIGTWMVDTIFNNAAGWPHTTRPTSYTSYRVVKHKLDSLKRIIESTEYKNGVPGRPIVYHYDQNGNLRRPDDPRYKLNVFNPRQTNKVWMFLDRDYSINVPVLEAGEFNKERLPKKLIRGELAAIFGIIYDGGYSVVTYSCP